MENTGNIIHNNNNNNNGKMEKWKNGKIMENNGTIMEQQWKTNGTIMESEGKIMEYFLHIYSVLNMFFDIVHRLIVCYYFLEDFVRHSKSTFPEKKGIIWSRHSNSINSGILSSKKKYLET